MALIVGCRVRSGDLQSAEGAKLNGLTGTVTGYIEESDRWEVFFEDCKETKLLKATNLSPCEMETTSGGFCTSCAQPLAAAGAACPSCDGSDASAVLNLGIPLLEALPVLEAVPVLDSLPVLAAVPITDDSLYARSSSSLRVHSEPRTHRELADVSGTAAPQDPSIGQLRRMLEEWQSANTQWQVAYAQMSDRCLLLESENRQLRDVVEAAESGPDMCARYVARLARQNWRLGQEVAENGGNCDASDGDGDLAAAAGGGESDVGEVAEEDSGRDRRPLGITRLPLRRNDAPDTSIVNSLTADEASESEQLQDEQQSAESLDFLDKEALDEAGNSLGGSRPKPGMNAQQWRELVEERKRLRERSQPKDPRGDDVPQISSSWATLPRLAASGLVLIIMATFSLGRFTAIHNGGDIEL